MSDKPKLMVFLVVPNSEAALPLHPALAKDLDVASVYSYSEPTTYDAMIATTWINNLLYMAKVSQCDAVLFAGQITPAITAGLVHAAFIKASKSTKMTGALDFGIMYTPPGFTVPFIQWM